MEAAVKANVVYSICYLTHAVTVNTEKGLAVLYVHAARGSLAHNICIKNSYQSFSLAWERFFIIQPTWSTKSYNKDKEMT